MAERTPERSKILSARTKDWQRRNPEKVKIQKRRKILRKYGMTPEDYDLMLESQDGSCYICRKKPTPARRLAVDHNHATGEIRGLLCTNCNQMLGTFHEKIEVFARAAEYLTAPPSRQVFAMPRRHVDAPPIALLSSDMEND